jgi:uncharacterized protein YacL
MNRIISISGIIFGVIISIIGILMLFSDYNPTVSLFMYIAGAIIVIIFIFYYPNEKKSDTMPSH